MKTPSHRKFHFSSAISVKAARTSLFAAFCLVTLIFLAAAPKARAALIDLFLDPEQSASKFSGGAAVTAPPMDLTNSLFDTRHLTVSRGVQRLTIANGLATYEVFPPPLEHSDIPHGYFLLEYRSATPVNLLGGGAHSLRIVFETISVPYHHLLDLVLTSGGKKAIVKLNTLENAPDGATLDIPFQQISGVDLTKIDSLTLDAARMPVGTHIAISSITTVPEPSAMCLAACAGLALAARRGNRRPLPETR